MNRITKDTPVGTRVVFRCDNRLTRGEYKGAADFDCLCRVWSRTRGELLVSRDEVHLDEPAPGTWAWACSECAANPYTHYRSPTEMREQFTVYCDADGDLCLADRRAFFMRFPIRAGHIAATDWEIAP